jgi:hypothetical protein
MHGNVSPRARRRIAADRRDGAREDALRLLEPKGAEEDEEMTAGLAKATSNDAHSATRPWRCGIPFQESAGMRMLEHEPPAPGVDVRNATAPTLLLRPSRGLSANALEVTRLVL